MNRLFAILLGALVGHAVYGADRPNLVLVLFDDLGWGQPPSYRAESALRTPNLDQLAQEGMRFTDAHTASAVCTPTRYGVLTGRYPTRIGQFGVLTTYSKPIIPPTRLTVASLLQQHGYATACIGKWHLGLEWVDGKPGSETRLPVGARFTSGPNALGFDYFCGFTHARNIGSILEHDRVVANVTAIENQPLMIQKAVAWLRQRPKDQPFFLYFPMCPPHTPIAPAAEFVGRSGARDPVGNDPAYGDWLYQGDHMLGQIVEALERTGLARNTLLIATSDNGAEGRPYAPLRGSKRSIYEGGHRVPFAARWPGRIAPGTVCDDVICLNDLLATAAEIVGAKLPDAAGEDSVSILPALLGTARAPVREATLHQSSTGDLAIRQGPWKAIFHKDGQRELFQLADDLSETTDVLGDHPAVARRLNALLQEYLDRGRSTPGAAQRNEYPLSLPSTTLRPKAARSNRTSPPARPDLHPPRDAHHNLLLSP
ncbi:MAG: arylsulfatase [Verrucomicrobia bacterium]|nr:arylsulfatase [Verrucomicrobiota bacterium]